MFSQVFLVVLAVPLLCLAAAITYNFLRKPPSEVWLETAARHSNHCHKSSSPLFLAAAWPFFGVTSQSYEAPHPMDVDI